MPRMDKLSKYRTTFETGDHGGSVTYVRTRIVAWDKDGNVTLNSGGWRTITTKRKMCQAARQFTLGYAVYQVKGEWFVGIWSAALSRYVKELPFKDGMTFNPRQTQLAAIVEKAFTYVCNL